MYLKTVTEVRRAVVERQKRAGEIRQIADEFARQYCGIDGYTKLLERHLPFLCELEGQSFGILARQIASCNVEEAVCLIGSRAMGLNPITLTFFRDSFTSENHDKRARLFVPWVWHSPKDKLVIDTAYVGNRPMGQFEKRPLDKIGTNLGLPLPSFHSMIRRVAFKSGDDTFDVSRLHNETLCQATRKPSEVYICGDRGRDQKVVISDLTDLSGVRPPASWYYPLYLSWFLDGRMVLLETYEDLEKSVHKAKTLFEETMRKIEQATGFKPLVAQLPYLGARMLYCNRHLLDKPCNFEGWDGVGENEFLPTALERVADKVIGYC